MATHILHYECVEKLENENALLHEANKQSAETIETLRTGAQQFEKTIEELRARVQELEEVICSHNRPNAAWAWKRAMRKLKARNFERVND